jgi:hypothetical protein
MIKHYTLENKPEFNYGDIVKFDCSMWGHGSTEIKTGKIVGRSSDYIIDRWLVEFDDFISESMPFKVAAIQHTFIIDEN